MRDKNEDDLLRVSKKNRLQCAGLRVDEDAGKLRIRSHGRFKKIYVGCVYSPGARIEVSNRARNSVQKAVMSVSNQGCDLYVLGSMGLFDKQPRRRL